MKGRADSNFENQIVELVSPILDSMGYTLVQVLLSGSQNKTIQVMAERKDSQYMAVKDCIMINKKVSNLMNAEGLFPTNGFLEISSPGIDRPLVCPSDYDRYAGFDVKIEMKVSIEGRKKFNGQLLGIDENTVLVMQHQKIYQLPVKKIHRAKLLLTDALVRSTTKLAEGQV